MIKYIFFILIIPSFCFAQFGGHAEFGKDIESQVFYTDLIVNYTFNLKSFYIMPYCGQITWMENETGNLFEGSDPFRDTYYIGLESGYKNVIFGIEHFCSHAVYDGNNWQKYNDPPHNKELTKIFARYNFGK